MRHSETLLGKFFSLFDHVLDIKISRILQGFQGFLSGIPPGGAPR
jgi:hypothetical protein